ncbi:MAG: aldo/keto reductase [Candidatus Woesearchaeota archaeon]
MMEYYDIGNSKMPSVGLGTWQLTGKECTKAVENAIRIGYKHIDTADAYSNHNEVGLALRNTPREELFITTKVWRTDIARQDLISSGKRALQELGIEYIDLYLVHWPNKDIPMEETFEGLLFLKKEGLIKEFGVSNFTINHLDKALKITDEVRVNQVEFHPLFYQKDLLDYCNKNNIRLTAYSPIGRGEALKHPVIRKIAEETGHTPAQVCLSWILSKGICVIPKSGSDERQLENIESAGIVLEEKHIKQIDDIRKTHYQRMINPGFGEF